MALVDYLKEEFKTPKTWSNPDFFAKIYPQTKKIFSKISIESVDLSDRLTYNEVVDLNNMIE